jgi:VanZ family protein
VTVPPRRLLSQGPFAAAVLFSLVVLFTPGPATPSVHPGVDKFIHLGLFAVLALTGRRAGLPPVGLACGLVAYAAVSEVLQAVLPIGRDGEVLDAVADSVGVSLALLATQLRAARRPRSA